MIRHPISPFRAISTCASLSHVLINPTVFKAVRASQPPLPTPTYRKFTVTHTNPIRSLISERKVKAIMIPAHQLLKTQYYPRNPAVTALLNQARSIHMLPNCSSLPLPKDDIKPTIILNPARCLATKPEPLDKNSKSETNAKPTTNTESKIAAKQDPCHKQHWFLLSVATVGLVVVIGGLIFCLIRKVALPPLALFSLVFGLFNLLLIAGVSSRLLCSITILVANLSIYMIITGQ